VDPAAIDERGDYPKEVIDGLAPLGAFGMKIPLAGADPLDFLASRARRRSSAMRPLDKVGQ
jgi:hypothetical protein